MRPHRARRRLRTLLVILGSAYVLLCVLARLVYPRLLFPAPRLDGPPELDAGKELLSFEQADGSRTAALYRRAPTKEGATIVVFHGNAETIFQRDDLIAELEKRGFGVLLVEYRGYGTTYGPPPTEAMLYEDGEAAFAYLAREGVPTSRIAVMGWSLGSSVAAEMAHRGHGRALVLMAPFTSMTAMGKRFVPFLPIALLMSHRLDTIGKAPRITQPTLVVHGEVDSLIPIAMGEEIARTLPDGTFVRVVEGHHNDLLVFGANGRPSAGEIYDRIAAHVRGALR